MFLIVNNLDRKLRFALPMTEKNHNEKKPHLTTNSPSSQGGVSGGQRTRSKTWPANLEGVPLFKSKCDCIAVGLLFAEKTYHMHFKDSPGYNADFKAFFA